MKKKYKSRDTSRYKLFILDGYLKILNRGIQLLTLSHEQWTTNLCILSIISIPQKEQSEKSYTLVECFTEYP